MVYRYVQMVIRYITFDMDANNFVRVVKFWISICYIQSLTNI